MALAAPPRLNGLADLLLRRPPLLRELIALVGYADDHAWFVGLVRRLFPQEAEAVLAATGIGQRVEGFARLFEERHHPLYAPFLEYSLSEEDEPPFTVLRRGIPYDLHGIGYEDLHQMWDGYREGLSALALLTKPPESFYTESDEIRVAWLESAAAHIPQDTLLKIPEGGIPQETLAGAVKGTRFEGVAQAAAWTWSETGNFFLDNSYEDGAYDGFSDPWDDEVIAEATEEWQGARAVLDSVHQLADWLEEDLPVRFAEMLEFILPRLPNQNTEDGDHE